jgi:acyl carrier protein
MFEKVKQILVDELQLKESDVTMDSELINDLGINSLELADLAMTCEEEFNIEIQDDDIRRFITVRDIVEYLESLEG